MDLLIKDYFDGLNPEAFNGCGMVTPGSENCLDCFKDQYFGGNEISYDCVEKRKLYFLRYFPVHKAENYCGATIIPRDVLDGWMENGHVEILSVGGGPGSDICGVLEFLEEEEDLRSISLSVNIVRVDVETQWDDMFDDVMQRLFSWANYRTVHLDVDAGFESLSGENFDLVLASYLTSELSTDSCLKLADDINSVLATDGVIMVNDRPENAVECDVRSMFDRVGFGYEERRLTSWAGYRYSKEVAEAVNPKFSMNSRVFVGVGK